MDKFLLVNVRFNKFVHIRVCIHKTLSFSSNYLHRLREINI